MTDPFAAIPLPVRLAMIGEHMPQLEEHLSQLEDKTFANVLAMFSFLMQSRMESNTATMKLAEAEIIKQRGEIAEMKAELTTLKALNKAAGKVA